MNHLPLLALALVVILPSVVAGSGLPFRDCNGDGYYGMTVAGVNPYPAILLLNTAICPPGSAWNDGQWVTEF